MDSGSQKTAPLTKNKKRASARIGAVQTLYASHISGDDITKAVVHFIQNGCMVEMDGMSYPADESLFTTIVQGVLKRQQDIIHIANSVLVSRSLERQNPLMGFILQAGIYELLENTDVDSRLIMSEYVDMAHAFFEPKEAGMVNGVLNAVSNAVRD